MVHMIMCNRRGNSYAYTLIAREVAQPCGEEAASAHLWTAEWAFPRSIRGLKSQSASSPRTQITCRLPAGTMAPAGSRTVRAASTVADAPRPAQLAPPSAPAATPEKRTSQKTHPYAERLPPPRKTGDELVDCDSTARHDMLKQIVSECLDDDSHVPLLFSTLRKRITAQHQTDGVESSQRFKALTTFKSIEQEWLVEWIVSRSDLIVTDLVGARTHDQDAVPILASWMTQLPLMMKLPSDLFIKVVMKRLLDDRDQKCGHRAQTFKSRGGLKPDGSLNLLQMSYRPDFTADGHLTKLTHCSGASIDVSDTMITSRWVLADNYSDYNSAFKKDPMPLVKAFLFFKQSGIGPCAQQPISSSGKEFKALVMHHYTQWDLARKTATGGNAAAAEAEKLINDQEKTKRKAQAEVARQKAQANLATKKQRRSIVL